MGYRSRLGKIKKTEREKIKGKTAEEIRVMYKDRDDAPYRPDEHVELYELGKYIEYSHDNEYEQYYDFNVYKEYESEFFILTKEDLKCIIDDYHEIVKNMYAEYFRIIETGKDEENEYGVGKLLGYFRQKKSEWNRSYKLAPYNLKGFEIGDIVGSWLYEYAIFNLVDIYCKFDWENDYLIYSAW